MLYTLFIQAPIMAYFLLYPEELAYSFERKKHQVSNKPTLIGGYNKQIDLTPDDVSAFVVEAVHHYWLLNGK